MEEWDEKGRGGQRGGRRRWSMYVWSATCCSTHDRVTENLDVLQAGKEKIFAERFLLEISIFEFRRTSHIHS